MIIKPICKNCVKVNDTALKDGACIGCSLNLASIPVLKNGAFRAVVNKIQNRISNNASRSETIFVLGKSLGSNTSISILHPETQARRATSTGPPVELGIMSIPLRQASGKVSRSRLAKLPVPIPITVNGYG